MYVQKYPTTTKIKELHFPGQTAATAQEEIKSNALKATTTTTTKKKVHALSTSIYAQNTKHNITISNV